MDIYIARQPIFGLEHSLYGYEFLYRNSLRNLYDPRVDGSAATQSLLCHLIPEFGLEALTGGTHAFVNFTRDLLDGGFPYLFENSEFVIEILEDVGVGLGLMRKLYKLKERGYVLALDDYTGNPALDEMAQLVDILKVDFKLTSPQEQMQIAHRFFSGKILLAEKIETLEEFSFAKQNHYTLFQGFYLSQPMILTKRTKGRWPPSVPGLLKSCESQSPTRRGWGS